MGNGPGVSVERRPDGTWRVRWREWTEIQGVRSRVQRSRVVSTEADAIDVRAKILRALERGEIWEESARELPVVASFDAVCAAWLRHKLAIGREPSTILRYGFAFAAFFRAARRARQLKDNAPLPVNALSASLFTDVLLLSRNTDGERSAGYATRVALDAWTWAGDDPARWPGIPVAPRDKTAILPSQPPYEAGPAPTIAELDACLSRLNGASRLMKAGIIMRYTGLRIQQVYELDEEDIDLQQMVIVVRGGKSRREKASIRRVPITEAFVNDIGPYLSKQIKGPGASTPSERFRRAWEIATEDGKVRREVWAPRNRTNSRPDHAFRAGFQAHLVRAGVRDEVISALVGHAPGIRGRHYVGLDSMADAMRAAVELIPPISWDLDCTPVEVRRNRRSHPS